MINQISLEIVVTRRLNSRSFTGYHALHATAFAETARTIVLGLGGEGGGENFERPISDNIYNVDQEHTNACMFRLGITRSCW